MGSNPTLSAIVSVVPTRSGFRLRAPTPASRLKFKSHPLHQMFDEPRAESKSIWKCKTLKSANSFQQPGRVARSGPARSRRWVGNRSRVSRRLLRNGSVHPPVSKCGGCDSSQ